MQYNSQLINLLLYYPKKTQTLPRIPERVLPSLLSTLSNAGRRSLLFRLEKNGYITREFAHGERVLVGTDVSRRAVEQQFPVLISDARSWNGEWSIVLFLQPPKHDKNFRYLRSNLLAHKALDLTRGVYGYPGQLPLSVLNDITERYESAVHVVSVSEWIVGSIRPIVIKKYLLQSLLDIYSGISDDITNLLRKKDGKKRLKEKEIALFNDSLKRFYDVLGSDNGILSYYFPGSPDAKNILRDLQLIVHLL